MRLPALPILALVLLMPPHAPLGAGQENTKPENQNPQISLRSRLGTPVEETFLVNSDFIASVKYGKSATPCRVLLKSRRPASTPEEDRRIVDRRINDLLEQLVPVAIRGKEVENGFVDLKCKPDEKCAGSYRKWETVTIFYWSVHGRPNPYQYATIEWADPKCLLPD